MKSVAVVAAAAVLVGAAPPQDPSVWRFPYAHSPYVTMDAKDGLPDVHFDRLTGDQMACPVEMQTTCCNSTNKKECCTPGLQLPSAEGVPGKGHFCKKADKFCTGPGHNATIKEKYYPHYVGRCDTKNRPAIKRSRRNILERAIGWILAGAPYHGCGAPAWTLETCASDDHPNCPQYEHFGSCCGYIAMVMGTAHWQGAHEARTNINCKDLAPGDVLAHVDVGGGTGHWQLFRSWATGKVFGPMKFYQMGGGGGNANYGETAQPKFCDHGAKKPCFQCSKYKFIVNDTYATAEATDDIVDLPPTPAEPSTDDLPEYVQEELEETEADVVV